MKIALLMSGGIDSLCMEHIGKLKYPKAEFVKVYYNIGHENRMQEMRCLAADTKVRKVDWYKDGEEAHNLKEVGPWFIPARNAVFALLAAAQELPDEVWYGVLYYEFIGASTSNDKDPKFIKTMNALLAHTLAPYMDKPPELKTPLVDLQMTKAEMMQYCLENGMKESQITNTHSCYRNSDQPCGNCHACLRNWCNLYQMNRTDLLNFKTHPVHSEHGKHEIEALMKQDPETMDTACKYEVLPALSKYMTTASFAIDRFKAIDQ